jgi:hypothetical protein
MNGLKPKSVPVFITVTQFLSPESPGNTFTGNANHARGTPPKLAPLLGYGEKNRRHVICTKFKPFMH